jgi:hypothetical protein
MGQRVINEKLGAAGSTQCGGACYSPMTTFDNLIDGNYSALVAGLNKRPGNIRYLGNTFFSASFTWSHNLNNGSEQNTTNGTSEKYLPAANPHAEYGNADIDLPWRFVLSGGWTLPFDQWGSQNALTKKIVGGWTLYPIFSTQTGSPIDMSAYSASNPQSIPGPSGYGDRNAVRPDVLGSRIHKLDPHQLQTITDGQGNTVTGNFTFNPADLGLDPCIVSSFYDTCPVGFYGTYRRNSFIGPGSTNLDLALGKKIPVNERLTAEFRAESFNLFNHAEFVNPPGSNTRITSSSFGVISSTLPQRILQLALRIDF